MSAVAELSVPCMEPILQMWVFFCFFFLPPRVHLCSTGAFLITISSGGSKTLDHGSLQIEQIGI